MPETYDLVVLGVGMAAVSAANKCAAAGWSVAVVDELPFGGTCALRGCDPKKILRRGAEIVDAAHLMRGKGVEADGLRIDWAELVAFKRSFTDAMPDRIEGGLERNGVATFHGAARFVSQDAIEVAGGPRIEGRHFLIATGARPRTLDLPGAEHLIDSTRFMELVALPERILFVGGGFISFEFAHIAARAGSAVRIIDRGRRPLKAFDPDLVDRLINRGKEAGIDFHGHADLKSVERRDGGFHVVAEVDGATRQWDVDLVVHGAGRVPAIDRLELGLAQVESSAKGVVVDEHLQSVSNAVVYAAGDCADTPGTPLTPVAVFEGKVAASNMLKGNKATADYRGVPSVVFTIPELARVGMLESEAKEQGRDVRVVFNDTGDWYSNMRVGETCAAAKVLIDRETGCILGAHLLGPEYSELINFFGLAIRLELTSGDLGKLVASYPSVGSDLGSLLQD